VCDRNGVVVDGSRGEGDRVVLASIVNADNSTAATLTSAFTRIMDAPRRAWADRARYCTRASELQRQR